MLGLPARAGWAKNEHFTHNAVAVAVAAVGPAVPVAVAVAGPAVPVAVAVAGPASVDWCCCEVMQTICTLLIPHAYRTCIILQLVPHPRPM